jgi:hypothetical protein
MVTLLGVHRVLESTFQQRPMKGDQGKIVDLTTTKTFVPMDKIQKVNVPKVVSLRIPPIGLCPDLVGGRIGPSPMVTSGGVSLDVVGVKTLLMTMLILLDGGVSTNTDTTITTTMGDLCYRSWPYFPF